MIDETWRDWTDTGCKLDRNIFHVAIDPKFFKRRGPIKKYIRGEF